MIPADSKAAARAEAARLTAHFVAAGAVPIEADILQPADILLDLYGEDIRARAYVTHDPLRGEMMLRPDFTVPVVQMHMSSGADPARYTYAGEVFRRQETDTTRPSEYLQVGYEVFDGQSPEAADAEVFATISAALPDLKLRAAVGDIGILLAAVRGLTTSDARKGALIRHLWRPRKFRVLMDRFSRPTDTRSFAAITGPEIGLRSRAEVEARMAVLQADSETPPLPVSELAQIDALFSLRAPASQAVSALAMIAQAMPAIRPALDRLLARLDALAARGVDLPSLSFEGSFGRTTLEYYDGFVFGLYADGRPDLPPVATGGRYDALTRVLGQGRHVPAVGGVIRPELVVILRGRS